MTSRSLLPDVLAHQEAWLSVPAVDERTELRGLTVLALRADEGALGLLREGVRDAVIADDAARLAAGRPARFTAERRPDDGAVWRLVAADWLAEASCEVRTREFEELARSWKDGGLFPEQLARWRGEELDVYGYGGGGEPILRIERTAVALFGFHFSGVHMNGACSQSRSV